MTIKELVGKSVEELEAMTQDQLMEWCAPYIKVIEGTTIADDSGDSTVDLEQKAERKERRSESKAKSKEDMLKMMHQLAQLHGVDLNSNLPKGLK